MKNNIETRLLIHILEDEIFISIGLSPSKNVDFLVIEKKRLDQRDKVNFKIYDITTWLTNNYNTHIAQYLTKEKAIRQLNLQS